MSMREPEGTRLPRVRHRSSRRAGLTLIEVSISVAIVIVLLLASAAAFGESLKAVDNAQRLDAGALFLDTTLESVGAVAFDDLLALDGNVITDGADPANSNFSVQLGVTPVGISLLQVSAILTDLRTGRRVGSVNTLRSAR